MEGADALLWIGRGGALSSAARPLTAGGSAAYAGTKGERRRKGGAAPGAVVAAKYCEGASPGARGATAGAESGIATIGIATARGASGGDGVAAADDGARSQWNSIFGIPPTGGIPAGPSWCDARKSTSVPAAKCAGCEWPGRGAVSRWPSQRPLESNRKNVQLHATPAGCSVIDHVDAR